MNSKTLIVAAQLFLTGCVFTTAASFQPEFKHSTDSVRNEISQIVTCQKLEFKGKQTNSTGSVKLDLEIDITNAKNKPAEESALDSMALSILSVIRENLKDRNAFSSYNIKFITPDSTGGYEYKSIVFTPERH